MSNITVLGIDLSKDHGKFVLTQLSAFRSRSLVRILI